jgi:hypothetical protein
MYKSMFFLLIFIVFLGVSCNNQEGSIQPNEVTDSGLKSGSKYSLANDPVFILYDSKANQMLDKQITYFNSLSDQQKQGYDANMDMLDSNYELNPTPANKLAILQTWGYTSITQYDNDVADLQLKANNMFNLSIFTGKSQQQRTALISDATNTRLNNDGSLLIPYPVGWNNGNLVTQNDYRDCVRAARADHNNRMNDISNRERDEEITHEQAYREIRSSRRGFRYDRSVCRDTFRN